jgi:hypothetical protein
MLDKNTLSAYWESQNPKEDIRMCDSLGTVTVFWDKDLEYLDEISGLDAISSAQFFRIGEQDWISRDQMEIRVHESQPKISEGIALKASSDSLNPSSRK